MRLTLLAPLLLATATVLAQEATPSAAPLQRHHLSTDVLADAAGRINLRYAFSIFASGEAFVQVATQTEGGLVSAFDTVTQTTDFRVAPTRFDAQRVTDVYLGYRQRFGPVGRAGRFYLDGGVLFKHYGAFREDYLAARQASGLPERFDVLSQRSIGFGSAFGYIYRLRGGWTLDARLGVQAELQREENLDPIFSSSVWVFEALGPRSSTLLTVGKRF